MQKLFNIPNSILIITALMLSALAIHACLKNYDYGDDSIKSLENMLGVKMRSVSMTTDSSECFTTCPIVIDSIIDTVQIPGTSCFAQVKYSVHRCLESIGPVKLTEIFNNFSASPIYGMGCDSLVRFWDSLHNSSLMDSLILQIERFHVLAGKAAEEKYMKKFVINNKSIFDCSTNNVLLFADFYWDQCYTWCFKYIIVNNKPQTDYQRRSCGEACCKRSTRYCWDSVDNMVKKFPPTVETIGFCMSELPAQCPEGYNVYGLCSQACLDQE